MLDFNISGEVKESKGFVPQWFDVGINLAKIVDIEFKTSSTGKNKILLHMEGKPIEAFEGVEKPNKTKCKGLYGKIALSNYYKDLTQQQEVNWLKNNLSYIAEKAEALDKLKELKPTSVEDLLTKFKEIVANKFMWFVFAGEEGLYDGKVYTYLHLKAAKLGEENGVKIFQCLCKHENFSTGTEKEGDKEILKGVNVVGANKGNKDSLYFDKSSTYDFKGLVSSDVEDDAFEGSASIEDF